MQSKSIEKCSGLKKSHFHLDYTHLKMPEEIKNTPVYIWALQSLSPNVNSNEPSNEEIKKAIKQNKRIIKHHHMMFETEMLKIVYPHSNSKTSFSVS